MNGSAIILTAVFTAPMLLIAFFLLNGKGAFLIAGYNTMSEDKRKLYNEKALCRFVGWLLIALCALSYVIGTGIALELAWLRITGYVLCAIVLTGGLIYANTGNRFQTKEAPSFVENSALGKSSGTKAAIASSAILSVAVLIAVAILVFVGAGEPSMELLDGKLQIGGMYGLDISYSEISDITLLNQSMKQLGPGRRTNGYGGFGDTLKGHFQSDNLGQTLLFVRANSSPTLRLTRTGARDIYISFKDSAQTEKLYNDLLAVMP